MAAQNLKIEDDPWRIICLNMGCGSDKTTVGERRPTVELVLKSKSPDIVFAQEIPGANVYRWKLDIPEHFYTTTGSKEAGFVWNTKRLEKCSEFDAGKKSDIIASMRHERNGSGVRKWSDEALANISTRSCVVHFRQKDARAGACNDVIAVSWHGEWRQKRGVRVESFKALQQFALLMRRKHFSEARRKPSIVIGGDFNLAIKDGEGLHGDFVLPSYQPSTRRKERVGDETIDFFLHTKDVLVKDIAPLEMTLDKSSSFTEEELGSLPIEQFSGKGEDKEAIRRRLIESMDHDPVKAYLVFREFGSSFELMRSPPNESRPTVLEPKQIDYSLVKCEVERKSVGNAGAALKSAEKYQGVSKKSGEEEAHPPKHTNGNGATALVPKRTKCPASNIQGTHIDTTEKRRDVKSARAAPKSAEKFTKSEGKKAHCPKHTKDEESTATVCKQTDCPPPNIQETHVNTTEKRKHVKSARAASKSAEKSTKSREEKSHCPEHTSKNETTATVPKPAKCPASKVQGAHVDTTEKRKYVKSAGAAPKSAEKSSKSEKAYRPKHTNDKKSTATVPEPPTCPVPKVQNAHADITDKRKYVETAKAAPKSAQKSTKSEKAQSPKHTNDKKSTATVPESSKCTAPKVQKAHADTTEKRKYAGTARAAPKSAQKSTKSK